MPCRWRKAASLVKAAEQMDSGPEIAIVSISSDQPEFLPGPRSRKDATFLTQGC